MREIKFRGKRIDNGDWVYGAYLWETSGICAQIGEYDEEGAFWEWHEVDPETVGEYTGLPDKNGKEIYEHGLTMLGTTTLEVYWNSHRSEFALREFGTNDYYGALGDFRHDIEIIGNIHDNPELLK
jgi:uncharacterized phage protein (TIGR01671 family)